jgi:hypothetical protein
MVAVGIPDTPLTKPDDGRDAVAHGEPLIDGFWILSKQVEWADGSPMGEGDRERIVTAFRAAKGSSRKWRLVVDDEGMDGD